MAFEGTTGLVDFYDSGTDPNKLYHGDRRWGFFYSLLNYVDIVQGLVRVGSWTPCNGGGSCGWTER